MSQHASERSRPQGPASYFEPARAILDGMLQFGAVAWPRAVVAQGIEEFFPGCGLLGPPAKRLAMTFSEWLALDWPGPGGMTLARRYRVHERLAPDVRGVVVELERSVVSAYEVTDVIGGDALAVTDGFRGTKLIIEMPGVGDRLPKGCTLIARAYAFGSAHRVTAPCIGLDCAVRYVVEPVRQALARECGWPPEQDWHDALKRHGANLLARIGLQDEWAAHLARRSD